jgi:hypothetical protein
MRPADATIFALIVVQAVGGLAAGLWRSTRHSRRHGTYVDLTDMTSLSRSAAQPRGGWFKKRAA